jgi:hypothetical protein
MFHVEHFFNVIKFLTMEKEKKIYTQVNHGDSPSGKYVIVNDTDENRLVGVPLENFPGEVVDYATEFEVFGREAGDKIVTAENLDGGVKRLKLSISQEGVNDPTIDYPFETRGEPGIVTLERVGVGQYELKTSANYFVPVRTYVTYNFTGTYGFIQLAVLNATTVSINTFDASGVPADSMLNFAMFLFEVYPEIN